MDFKIALENIIEAQKKMKGVIKNPALLKQEKISKSFDCDIYFKYENYQYTNSFKERGAYNFLINLSEIDRKKGVVTMSAGNHAQGVAYHSSKLGIECNIVMPKNTPFTKVNNTEILGANVFLEGSQLVETNEFAQNLAKEHGYIFVHPYDDPYVIEGQGVIGLEIVEKLPDVDYIFVPIGGGGLISGIACAVKQLNPNIKVIGVQSELYPNMKNHIEGKNPIYGGSSVAEGISVKSVGKLTAEIVNDLVDEILLVSEDEIETALCMIAEYDKTVVEGAGATAFAGLAKFSSKVSLNNKKCVCILSGGNIDQRILSSVLMRNMVRQGRIGMMRINLPDVAGSLANVSKIIGDNGGNILEMDYQNMFSHATAKETTIEMIIETKDSSTLNHIITTLQNNGYNTVII